MLAIIRIAVAPSPLKKTGTNGRNIRRKRNSTISINKFNLTNIIDRSYNPKRNQAIASLIKPLCLKRDGQAVRSSARARPSLARRSDRTSHGRQTCWQRNRVLQPASSTASPSRLRSSLTRVSCELPTSLVPAAGRQRGPLHGIAWSRHSANSAKHRKTSEPTPIRFSVVRAATPSATKNRRSRLSEIAGRFTGLNHVSPPLSLFQCRRCVPRASRMLEPDGNARGASRVTESANGPLHTSHAVTVVQIGIFLRIAKVRELVANRPQPSLTHSPVRALQSQQSPMPRFCAK